ncbi:phosphate signaling complex protein PhoU [Candidatus Uhrbacteria bacterium]|nr:phosphate signaling complex protein PhoU [Candidatus Uhrbacteria bacterium]
MSIHLHRDLEELKKDILTMGGMVEDAIRKSIATLHDRHSSLAEEVIAGDSRIDRFEVHIEEHCLKILALHQPVAEDLRFIAAVIKMNNDLERMGDLAVNIAERAHSLAEEPGVPVPDRLRAMTDETMRMVRESLDAFVNRDVRRAREVCGRDDVVDDYNREVIGDLQRLMVSDPRLINAAMHLFSASRHLERIADHATNIAEDVVYLVEGEIVRHRLEEGTRDNLVSLRKKKT